MTPIYGARLTDHTPPNGSYYAVAGAPLDDPGTILRPCGDPQRVMTLMPAGATLVLDGVFPASLVQQWRRPVHIQPAPGRSAVLLGSDPATQWTRDGDLWWHTCPGFDHTPNGDILNPDRIWASWPEQVWMDDVPLEMVAPGAPLEPGQFSVGLTRVYIGTDPADHDMRIAVRRCAYTGSLDMQTGIHPPTVMRGVEVWHYATESRDRAAVKVYGDSHLEDVTVGDCSAAGISVMRSTGASVRNCTVTGAGQLGIHGYLADDLELGYSLIGGCNRKGFSYVAEAGAVKVFASLRARTHHNLLTATDGHGLWWDGDSHDGWFWRNDIEGCRTGIFEEMSNGGHIYGNRATDCIVGVLLSAAADTTVTHNTMTGNDADIRDQADGRRADMRHTNLLAGNITTDHADPAVPPSLLAGGMLELTLEETARASVGWYGPEYTPSPPPEESPTMYDLEPLSAATSELADQIAAAGTEIRRLEALIANDDHLATIATLTAQRDDLAIQFWNATVQLNQANATIASQQTTINNLTAQVSTLLQDYATVQQERDTAQAANEEAQELLGEQAVVIQTLDAQVADLIGERDVALATAAALQVDLDQVRADLAECEDRCPPDPVPSVIIGGSDKLGYPDLKARLTGVIPGSFTHYIAGPRFTAAEVTKMAEYVADGVIPSLSFHPGTQADTDYNMTVLVAQGWDTLAGGYSIGNEPTQKTTPAATWRAANQYAMSVLPESWTLVLGPFQRVDIHAAVTDPRFIGNWIGPDTTWIDPDRCMLGVNVYDKHHNNAQSFATLVDVIGDSGYSVEDYARALGLKIWVREAGAPEEQTGEWLRPAGWKPEWYYAMWLYVSAGPELYQAVNVFNSDVGGDPPPEGWWAWTSPVALQAYRDIIEFSQE